MKRKKWIVVGALLAGLLLVGATMAQGTPAIDWSVIAGGGGSATSGNLSLDSVVGQWTAVSSARGTTELWSGFLSRGGEPDLCPRPLTGVSIEGLTGGYTGTYTFTAAVTPADATEPITYTWSPAPDGGQGTASAEYEWATPDVYTLTLAAENCGGLVSATHTVTIKAALCIALDGVTLDGPTTTTVGVSTTFTAAVGPPDAAQPVTYTWEATGQAKVHTSGDLGDTAVFTWAVTGPQAVTVTAVNECGIAVSAAHTVTIKAAPCIALDGVTLDGPPTTTVGVSTTFTAAVGPPDAAQPITYTWEATGQAKAHTSGDLGDTAVFTWAVTGPQAVTITAVNECDIAVSITHTVTVTIETEQRYIYLPLVVRDFTPWWAAISPRPASLGRLQFAREAVWKITLRNNSQGGANYESQKSDN